MQIEAASKIRSQAFVICKFFRLLLVAVLLLQTIPVSAQMTQPSRLRIAVLDFYNSTDGELAEREVRYIAQIVRGGTRQSLPANRYILMTRENIIAMLPPGRALSDCFGECAVATGRNIGADFVVTGEVVRFGNELRVTINLHETKVGNLLGQSRVGARNILDLEAPLEEKALELLQVLRPQVGIVLAGGETDLGGGVQAWSATGAGFAVVNFVSDPPGATVELDGVPLCATPCSQALPAGTVEVAFKLLRYMPWSSIVMITTDMVPVSATLTPNFGWLTVTSEPVGLIVELDGASAGLTPVERLEVGYGLHEVWVRDPFRHDEGKRVMIERGGDVTLHLRPVPINGGLQMEAKDKDGNALQGDVWVDDKKVGKAWIPLTVQAGPREVAFRGKRGTWRELISVPAEELLVVQAEVRGEANAGKNSIGMEMVRITAGSFLMGSPLNEKDRDRDERQHQVTLIHDFLMSATEVTQAQYKGVTGKSPSHFKGIDLPVEKVSWYDAVKFCNQLSEQEGLTSAYMINAERVTLIRDANGYRLPTEEEWEYSCRAGATTRFHSGHSKSKLDLVAWYEGNSRRKTHPVAQKKPNAWGLYDMHGNVWEWCWDRYGDYPQSIVANTQESSTGSSYVLRGGCWAHGMESCRSSFRAYNSQTFCNHGTSFRPVRSIN